MADSHPTAPERGPPPLRPDVEPRRETATRPSTSPPRPPPPPQEEEEVQGHEGHSVADESPGVGEATSDFSSGSSTTSDSSDVSSSSSSLSSSSVTRSDSSSSDATPFGWSSSSSSSSRSSFTSLSSFLGMRFYREPHRRWSRRGRNGRDTYTETPYVRMLRDWTYAMRRSRDRIGEPDYQEPSRHARRRQYADSDGSYNTYNPYSSSSSKGEHHFRYGFLARNDFDHPDAMATCRHRAVRIIEECAKRAIAKRKQGIIPFFGKKETGETAAGSEHGSRDNGSDNGARVTQTTPGDTGPERVQNGKRGSDGVDNDGDDKDNDGNDGNDDDDDDDDTAARRFFLSDPNRLHPSALLIPRSVVERNPRRPRHRDGPELEYDMDSWSSSSSLSSVIAGGEPLCPDGYLGIAELCRRLHVDPRQGLSDEQVAERLEIFGANDWSASTELQASLERHWPTPSDGWWYDAEIQVEQAARTRVYRNGNTGPPEYVPSCTLVPGDIVYLSHGDVVPADIRLIYSHQCYAVSPVLRVDEYVHFLVDIFSVENKYYTPNYLLHGTRTGAILERDIDDNLFKYRNILITDSIVTHGHVIGIVARTGMNRLDRLNLLDYPRTSYRISRFLMSLKEQKSINRSLFRRVCERGLVPVTTFAFWLLQSYLNNAVIVAVCPGDPRPVWSIKDFVMTLHAAGITVIVYIDPLVPLEIASQYASMSKVGLNTNDNFYTNYDQWEEHGPRAIHVWYPPVPLPDGYDGRTVALWQELGIGGCVFIAGIYGRGTSPQSTTPLYGDKSHRASKSVEEEGRPVKSESHNVHVAPPDVTSMSSDRGDGKGEAAARESSPKTVKTEGDDVTPYWGEDSMIPMNVYQGKVYISMLDSPYWAQHFAAVRYMKRGADDMSSLAWLLVEIHRQRGSMGTGCFGLCG